MSIKREEDLLECPVCWEAFNLIENVPYILWCGHTLCKTCILSLRPTEVKFPTLSIYLPLFISCPWCQLLSFRLVWKGNLRFPSKNFFLLWLVVEGANGNQIRNCLNSSFHGKKLVQPSSGMLVRQSGSTEHLHEPTRGLPRPRQVSNHLLGGWGVCAMLRKSLALFMHLTAKFPVVVIFMLIVLYVIPVSAAILVVYFLITFLFALPSFLVLYFSYPILDWLVKEIIA